MFLLVISVVETCKSGVEKCVLFREVTSFQGLDWRGSTVREISDTLESIMFLNGLLTHAMRFCFNTDDLHSQKQTVTE